MAAVPRLPGHAMSQLAHLSTQEVSARRAATMLGVSRVKVTALIYAGVLPAKAVARTYCIALADIDRVRRERPDLFPSSS